MAESKFRALVVDDEDMIRNLTMRALAQEGFQCDAASDGNEALALSESTRYDVVVTDLRMPNKHGHALAVDLLTRTDRPLIFVLTAVNEPRLAKDLISRGVDDIMFKPVEYSLLATKVKARVGQEGKKGTEAGRGCDDEPDAEANSVPAVMDAAEFKRGLSRIADVMPVSEDALEVYRMTESAEFDAHRVGRAIAKHDVMAVEVLQLANSCFYDPKRNRITDLNQGVVRIGQKRIGQLALAASALATLATGESSPLNLHLVRRRSVAAGLAMELLIALGNHRGISDGLLLCATTQELGRVVLASLYPQHYVRLLKHCTKTNRSLFELEQSTLPESPSKVMSEVLDGWKVPATLYAPLQHVQCDYESISQLSDPLRSQVELVKVAGLIAQMAIRTWEPWDYVEIPPIDVLDRLQLLSISTAIEETKRNIDGINDFVLQPTAAAEVPTHTAQTQTPKPLACYNAVVGVPFDFLAEIVSSMGVTLIPCRNPSMSRESVLANCVGIKSKTVLSIIDSCPESPICVICNRKHLDFYSKFERTVSMPTSYSALQNAVMGNAR